MKYHSRLFFKADPSSGGGGVAPGSTVSTVSSHSRMAQAGLPDNSGAPHPMDARPGSVFNDDSDDLMSAVQKGGTEAKSRGDATPPSGQDPTPASFFDTGFDPNSLEAPLRGVYTKMQEALNRRLAGAPDAETIGILGMKSQAFDKLVNMPEFQEWAARYTGGEAPSSDGKQAAKEAEDLLAGMDDETRIGIQDYIQRTVDRALADKVTPLADSYYGGEAERQLQSLQKEYGEHFQSLAPRAQALMQSIDGLMAEEAFKLANYDRLQASIAAAQQAKIVQKDSVNMLTTDGPSNTVPAQRTVRNPRDAFLLALEQVGRGEGWDPRTDLTQRAE